MDFGHALFGNPWNWIIFEFPSSDTLLYWISAAVPEEGVMLHAALPQVLAGRLTGSVEEEQRLIALKAHRELRLNGCVYIRDVKCSSPAMALITRLCGGSDEESQSPGGNGL